MFANAEGHSTATWCQKAAHKLHQEMAAKHSYPIKETTVYLHVCFIEMY
jgi:hypothetical protein